MRFLHPSYFAILHECVLTPQGIDSWLWGAESDLGGEEEGFAALTRRGTEAQKGVRVVMQRPSACSQRPKRVSSDAKSLSRRSRGRLSEQL